MSQMGISIYELFQVTFNDYKRDYNGYLTEFLNDYEDNTELYFIKEQKAIVDSHLVKFKEVVMKLVEEDENKEEILDLFRNRINTTDRIKEFLEMRKQELERESKDNTAVPLLVPEVETLDLSHTSAVEKIIYLNELGIIDFLRTKPEFMGSTNLMATFLSAITDVKATTLQSSLNRLINEDTEDKNHPYKAKGTANKIRQTFIDKNIKPKTS